MTTEQPPRPVRPPRPGPAARRAALGLAPEPGAVGVAPSPERATRRESLRDSLSRIPDLDRNESLETIAGPKKEPVPRSGAASKQLGAPVPSSAPEPTTARAPDVSVAKVSTTAKIAGPRSEVVPGDPSGRAETDAMTPEDYARAFPTDPSLDPRAIQPTGFRGLATRLMNGRLPADFDLQPDSEAEVQRPPTPAEPEVVSDLVPEVTSSAASTTLGDAPEWLVAAAEIEQRETERRSARIRTSGVPMWRRVGFAVAIVALIGSIPLLGRFGYRIVSESTDGNFTSSVRNPTDPGFEEEVVSTPTQLVLHKDEDGRPVSVTVLSLSGASGGGAVLFVPLDTEVPNPAYGVDRVIRAYDVLSARPADGRKQTAVQVASVINVGIDGVVELDDRGWAQLVAPVAPLAIENPDPIDLGDVTIDSGSIELTAEQVGPYLAAKRPGESPFNALVRHELVWDAWMTAIAESGRDDVVPGESSSGIGLFARSLAAGPVTYSVVPTTPDGDDPTLLRVDKSTLAPMVLAAVPNPDPATPGSRTTVRLLNGVSADPIPAGIVQSVVQIGGSVAVIGNGPSFGRDETLIVYSDPVNRGYAELLQAALGAGTVRLDPEADETVGLTVILGSDAIDASSATTTTVDLDAEPDGS